MSLSKAVAGHGATIAKEMNPIASPGVFTVIAELNGDIKWPQLSRPETDVTPHQANIDNWVLGILTRGPLTFSVNFIFNDPTHDHLTGLYSNIGSNSKQGFRLRGPGGSVGVDEWIASGQVQQIMETAPVRQGARTADITIRLSGPMIIDTVSYGA